jgi:signal transduction histidine kinase/DNA-binding response OmpR family regulator
MEPFTKIFIPFSYLFKIPDKEKYFDAAEFDEYYLKQSKTIMQVSMILHLLAYSSFVYVDVFMLTETRALMILIRLFIFPLFFMSVFFLTFTKFFDKHSQLLVLIQMGIIGNIGCLALYFLPEKTELAYYYYRFAIIVFITAAMITSRLRFKYAFLVAISHIIAYDLLEIFTHDPFGNDLEFSLFVITNGYMIDILAIAGFFNLLIDKYMVNDYINQKKLKELDNLKTQFFSNVSHELRTPLTLILSPIESVIRGDTDPAKDNIFFTSIYRNAKRLLQLINNLLDFSKIEAGRMKLKREPVDMAKLMELFIANVQSGAESNGLSLTFENRTDESVISVDHSLMENAVYNLLSNAIKFTPPGGSIRVILRSEDRSLLIDVTDTGIGIPQEKQASIFERFTQLDGSSARKYEGTGIGLALTREIAQIHGGDVTLKSEHGKGSTFTLSIPKSAEDATVPLSKELIKKTTGLKNDYSVIIQSGSLNEKNIFDDMINSNSVSYSHKPGTEKKDNELYPEVLLVEDNKDMLEFLAEMLSYDYSVRKAINGKDALRMIAEEKYVPDIIVTDIMMPEMDGLEFVKNVRSDERFNRIPVIFLSAKADMDTLLQGFDLGGTDYITKPFNSSELLARIKAQIELKKLHDRLARSNEKLYARLAAATADNQNRVSDASEEKVRRVLDYINENYDSNLTRDELASAVNMNPDNLSRVFNKLTGKRIDVYINEIRIEAAKQLLKDTSDSVISIAYSVGYDNLRTFYNSFTKITNCTPTEYRIK